MTTTTTTTATTLLELGGSSVLEHVGGEETGGAFALLEFTVAPGYPTPPRHVHEREDELTYVLEGELEVSVGDEVRVLSAGQAIRKPRGVPHEFSLVEGQGARFLELLTPAGFEGYFRAIAAVLQDGGAPDPELTASLMASYGVTPA